MRPALSWRSAAWNSSTARVDRPWGLRTATFTDPDGHIWEVAAKIPA